MPLEAIKADQSDDGELGYAEIYRSEPSDRIKMVKDGLPAKYAKRILAGLQLPPGEALKAVDISPATLNRKLVSGKPLSTGESERVLGIAKMVGQVETMVRESGTSEGFDAEKWVSAWLRKPVPALGWQRPLDLLDTMEGQALVSQTLARMQSGAYG